MCIYLIRLHLILYFLPVNGGDAGNSVVVADALCQQPVSDLPRKHGWVLSLVVCDFFHDLWCGDFRFRPANNSWFDAAGLVISAKNIGSTVR